MSRPYGVLAAAIVHQAVKEWKDAMQVLKVVPEDEQSWQIVGEVERFFRSSWYQTLRLMTPETLPKNMIKKLKEMTI